MTDNNHVDVVIIGGGASGMAAAIELGMRDPELSVVVLEKMDEPGRKIRATGSGRCNITNRCAEGYTEIMKFFTRIGLATRTYDNGLVYPYSESAADVAALLASRAEELGVRIVTDAEVSSVQNSLNNEPASCEEGQKILPFKTQYTVKRDGRTREAAVRSRYVILACGGKAGPMFGTTGNGYRIARGLGHSIVTPVPVLTAVECSEWEKGSDPCAVMLAGTRTRGRVTLLRSQPGGGKAELFSETGEIQFTKTGLSGICVFNMTRHMRYERAAGESLRDFEITADLFPDGDIRAFLEERRTNAFPGEKVSTVLRTVLKENIAAYVLDVAMANASEDLAYKPVCDMTDRDIYSAADTIHRLVFHPRALRGWKEAQATSGGVELREIDPDTCESCIVPGLYITGELADRDYPCGGFNLSNAWLTGLRAARAIVLY